MFYTSIYFVIKLILSYKNINDNIFVYTKNNFVIHIILLFILHVPIIPTYTCSIIWVKMVYAQQATVSTIIFFFLSYSEILDIFNFYPSNILIKFNFPPTTIKLSWRTKYFFFTYYLVGIYGKNTHTYTVYTISWKNRYIHSFARNLKK